MLIDKIVMFLYNMLRLSAALLGFVLVYNWVFVMSPNWLNSLAGLDGIFLIMFSLLNPNFRD
jgi:hypothetical protein